MEPDVIGNACYLRFSNASFDYVVLHHVLEHLWRSEAPSALREAHRVLCPGGSCIVIVPDIRELAVRWLARMLKDGDTEMFTHCMGAYMGSVEDLHKWHYTPESLARALEDAGQWSTIKVFDWRQIPGADIASKDFWFHGVEAVK
jgi:ubiquinone/menaquinone biosynthesis C-methylase UbiE